MSNRQKYNFLAGWVKQLDQAMDEQDPLAGQAQEAMGVMELVKTYVELEDRIGKCEQWLAQHESALEELDDDRGESPGEESESYDDGDDDSDGEWDEPEVGRRRSPDGRLAPAVDGAGEGRGNRRGVMPTDRIAKVRVGSGKKQT